MQVVFVLRDAETDLAEQPRRAGHHAGAGFEKVVRQRPVAAVADERRAQESGVGVVAAAVEAERRPVAAGARAPQRARRDRGLLDVELHRPHAMVVGVRGAEGVGVLVPTCRPSSPRRRSASREASAPNTRSCVPAARTSSVERPTVTSTSVVTSASCAADARPRGAQSRGSGEHAARRSRRRGSSPRDLQRLAVADRDGAGQRLGAGSPRVVGVAAGRHVANGEAAARDRWSRSRGCPRPRCRRPCADGCCSRDGSPPADRA